MSKNGFTMSKRTKVEKLTKDRVLGPGDCGKLFVVCAQQASQIDITMPNRADADNGWNASFLFESGSASEQGFDTQDVAFSGAVGDSLQPPFLVNATHNYVGGSFQSGITGQAATVTAAKAKIKSGDLIRITMVEGTLGDQWALEGNTSGSLTVA